MELPASEEVVKNEAAFDDNTNEMTSAVVVRNAYLRYSHNGKRVAILQNFSMTVQKGTIYSLLGASGCGKTSVLACITGQKKLNSGIVEVFGQIPGSKNSGIPGKKIGYMPQNVELYTFLTIEEMFKYFGWIYDLPTSEITKRTEFLCNLLELPPKTTRLSNLSGGELRRVSFSVALIHDPELLILDEPSVGIDPLLRKTMWDHLENLTKVKGKTVVMTSHYIQEAEKSNTLGFLRNGKLLAEDSPKNLISAYSSSNLDSVFLKLAVSRLEIDNDDGKEEHDDSVVQKEEQHWIALNKDKVSQFKREKTKIRFSKIKALLYKNYLRKIRNMWILLFFLILPLSQTAIFYFSIGVTPNDLTQAIINSEVDMTSDSCLTLRGCSLDRLSCRFLDYLANDTHLSFKTFPSVDVARDALKKGKVWGVVHFSEHFSEAISIRLLENQKPDEFVLEQSEIRIWLDMTNLPISSYLVTSFNRAYDNFAKDLMDDCGKPSKSGLIPLQMKEPIFGKNTNYQNFVAPALLISLIFTINANPTSQILVAEKRGKYIERILVAGVNQFEIVISHIVLESVSLCVCTIELISLMIYGFGMECFGNIYLITLLTFLQGFLGIAFGFVVSQLSENEKIASYWILGMFFPILFISGYIWPLEGMPKLLQYISLTLPFTSVISAQRAMMSRGWPLTNPVVYQGFITALAWIIFLLTLIFIIARIKKHNNTF